jgi:putative addiction module component (TIGR02574 family)
MSTTMKSLGLDRLTLDERIVLVHELQDSIAAEIAAAPPGASLTDAKRRELDRRLAELDANPDDVIPWEQVKAEALARFRK